MSAPPAAPYSVYSFCSGVHDAHDETVKRATVAAAPIQFFHLNMSTPPWVSSNSGFKHRELCHFVEAKSIEKANLWHSAGFINENSLHWLHIGHIKKRPQPPTGLRPLADDSVSARDRKIVRPRPC